MAYMPPRLFDTHSHVNFKAFAEDRDTVIARALQSGVWMNVVGSQRDTSRSARDLVQTFDRGLYAVVGLHPSHLIAIPVHEEEDSFTTRGEVFDKEYYRSLITSDSRVVGVGECGLDYFRLPDSADSADGILDRAGIIRRQQEVFREHVELAYETKKALVVHTRQGERSRDSATSIGPNAYDDVHGILKSYAQVKGYNVQRTVIHCFVGTQDHAHAFIDLGCTLSFGGIITFKNAADLREIVKQTPIERIVIETDCPYLAPEPHRGKRNEPLYVEETAKYIAHIKSMTFDDVARITTENAMNVFGIETVFG